MMNEIVAQHYEDEAEAKFVEDEERHLALGLPQLPPPDGEGCYSEQQMYDYALQDRMRDFHAQVKERAECRHEMEPVTDWHADVSTPTTISHRCRRCGEEQDE